MYTNVRQRSHSFCAKSKSIERCRRLSQHKISKLSNDYVKNEHISNLYVKNEHYKFIESYIEKFYPTCDKCTENKRIVKMNLKKLSKCICEFSNDVKVDHAMEKYASDTNLNVKVIYQMRQIKSDSYLKNLNCLTNKRNKEKTLRCILCNALFYGIKEHCSVCTQEVNKFRAHLELLLTKYNSDFVILELLRLLYLENKSEIEIIASIRKQLNFVFHPEEFVFCYSRRRRNKKCVVL